MPFCFKEDPLQGHGALVAQVWPLPALVWGGSGRTPAQKWGLRTGPAPHSRTPLPAALPPGGW